MDFSLRPHPLVAHWVPGFVVVVATLFWRFNWSYRDLVLAIAPTTTSGTLSLFGLAVIAFVLGQILDAFRDSFWEWLWDYVWPLDWGFFFSGESSKIDNLEAWYFTYYVLDTNFFLGLVPVAILELFSAARPPFLLPLTVAGMAIFLVNAISLRKEIAQLIPQNRSC